MTTEADILKVYPADVKRDAQRAMYYQRALGRSSDIGPISFEQQDEMVALGVIPPLPEQTEVKHDEGAN